MEIVADEPACVVVDGRVESESERGITVAKAPISTKFVVLEKMDFYVYLSPKEAAEKVKEAVTAGLYSGEILDEYVRILPNGKEIIMVLFEKYYMRSGNRATLTFLADNLEEHTRVHLSAGGGGQGVIFRFDWGAGASFSTSARDALAEYICK